MPKWTNYANTKVVHLVHVYTTVSVFAARNTSIRQQPAAYMLHLNCLLCFKHFTIY